MRSYIRRPEPSTSRLDRVAQALLLSGMAQARDDLPTLIAIGASAAVVAMLAHEAVGHGGMCLARGGEITLLTAIVFHCLGGGPLTDAAGPLGGLLAGVAALAAASAAPLGRGRLFLLLLGTIAILWFFGQLVAEAAGLEDDWTPVARALGLPGAWRAAAGALGVAGYATALRWSSRLAEPVAGGEPMATRRRLLAPFAAAAVTATLAGLLWRQAPFASAADALLAVGVAPLGYLLVVRRAVQLADEAEATPIRRSWPWLTGAGGLVVVFALTVARGLGRLA